MKVKCFFLFTLIISFTGVNAQELSGEWKGQNGYSPFYLQPSKVVLELSFYNDSMITGVSHLYYTRNRYEHHKLSGRFNKTDSILTLSEDGIISYRAGLLDQVDEGIYKMNLSRLQHKWRLAGEWKSKRMKFFTYPKIDIWLEKDIAGDRLPVLMPVVIDSAGKEPEQATIKPSPLNRTEDIQLVIELDKKEKDSIRVEVYDNGEIDNDTVSVYENNTLVVNRQMISLKPILFYVDLNSNNPFNKLKLIADNLGSIPPNTALMVITTRKKRYEVLLSSTLSKNAVVEFFLKE